MNKAQTQRAQDKELIIPNSQSKGPLPNIAPSKAGFWEGRSGYGPNLQHQQTEYTKNILKVSLPIMTNLTQVLR
jgi:hypothetical protein